LQPLQLFNTMPLPWTVYKEAELGASKDKSGWRAFSKAEHVNLWRFNKQWGESQRQARCDEVSTRWGILKAPAKMLGDLQGANGNGGLRSKVKVFLNGPARAPQGGFTPPSRDIEADNEKAVEFEKQLQAMYAILKAKTAQVEAELSIADKPVPVRRFELVRKPQLARDLSAPMLPYGTKPEDYVLKPSDPSSTTATASGSPSVMADERYQKLLLKAQREWKTVQPILDPVFETIGLVPKFNRIAHLPRARAKLQRTQAVKFPLPQHAPEVPCTKPVRFDLALISDQIKCPP
jgi:hypothetical protein